MNELTIASAIWPLIVIDANVSDQLLKLYLFDFLTMCGGDEPLVGFWGKAPAAKRFPGYYRGLRERWMRESLCYFFCHTPKKWGVRYPVSYAYALTLRATKHFVNRHRQTIILRD